jgi:UDP-3-O-[3-hydroxymyristoyl] glucosamine N-acyltransferase
MPTLGDIAKALDLPFRGNPETPLSRLASLDSAGEGDLSFVAQKKVFKAARYVFGNRRYLS